jgi:hypothetical protein
MDSSVSPTHLALPRLRADLPSYIGQILGISRFLIDVSAITDHQKSEAIKRRDHGEENRKRLKMTSKISD